MNLYSTLVFLHVITAILGLGPLTLLATLPSGSGSNASPLENAAWVLRLVGRSLIGIFITGAAIIAMTHGALGQTGWMKAAFALFLFLGFLHAMARRQLRKARESSSNILPTPLRPIAWSMCAVTAAITYLMEAKPW